MNDLRRLLPDDSELADLRRQAIRAFMTELPDVFIGAILLAFCERFLDLAEPDHEARPLVEGIARELQRLAAEDGHEGDVGPESCQAAPRSSAPSPASWDH